MVKGVDVVARFRDQPVEGDEVKQKRSKEGSNDELTHCFVIGTMN